MPNNSPTPSPAEAANRLTDIAQHRRETARAYRQGLISDSAYRVVLADLDGAEWQLRAIVQRGQRSAG